jgi:hypothetical protein
MGSFGFRYASWFLDTLLVFFFSLPLPSSSSAFTLHPARGGWSAAARCGCDFLEAHAHYDQMPERNTLGAVTFSLFF